MFLREEPSENIGACLAAGDTERLKRETAPSAFWKLPREIRDMIYDDVYGGDGTVKVVVRKGWEWRERFQRSRYPTRRPFAESALSSMLVSKLYLSEAIQRYVEAKVFSFEDTWALHDALEKGCAINRHVLRFIRSVRVSVAYREGGLDPLATLPNLSKLELCIARWTLTVPGELPEDNTDSDLDLPKRLMVAGLHKLTGLKQVRVRMIDPSSEQTFEASHKVQHSLNQVEQGLARFIAQPKPAQRVTTPVQSVWEMLQSESLPSSQAPAEAPRS